MKFSPFPGWCEIEPIEADLLIQSSDKKFMEAGKVIGISNPSYGIEIGSIIFFQSHGYRQTVEYKGEIHYVVRIHEEFILGILHES